MKIRHQKYLQKSLSVKKPNAILTKKKKKFRKIVVPFILFLQNFSVGYQVSVALQNHYKFLLIFRKNLTVSNKKPFKTKGNV